MPTIISHPFVALAFYPPFRKYQFGPSIYLTGAVCSIFPDLDVIGFQFGISYGDLLGHRGLSHSIAFALVLSLLVANVFIRKQKSSRFAVFLFLFLCTLSHGILDAFTDGGLGVAFFSPFSNTRYFFPWRPLKVSPIGIFSFYRARL